MSKISKMLGAGVGSALAAVIVFAIHQTMPNMDQATLDSIKFIVYTILTMGSTYIAPANS
tara:strand:- start:1330 stop:1509 length:180 start_codon:yes stop_codon:yes gene_type:complete